jgi:hypothetical protein
MKLFSVVWGNISVSVLVLTQNLWPNNVINQELDVGLLIKKQQIIILKSLVVLYIVFMQCGL